MNICRQVRLYYVVGRRATTGFEGQRISISGLRGWFLAGLRSASRDVATAQGNVGPAPGQARHCPGRAGWSGGSQGIHRSSFEQPSNQREAATQWEPPSKPRQEPVQWGTLPGRSQRILSNSNWSGFHLKLRENPNKWSRPGSFSFPVQFWAKGFDLSRVKGILRT